MDTELIGSIADAIFLLALALLTFSMSFAMSVLFIRLALN